MAGRGSRRVKDEGIVTRRRDGGSRQEPGRPSWPSACLVWRLRQVARCAALVIGERGSPASRTYVAWFRDCHSLGGAALRLLALCPGLREAPKPSQGSCLLQAAKARTGWPLASIDVACPRPPARPPACPLRPTALRVRPRPAHAGRHGHTPRQCAALSTRPQASGPVPPAAKWAWATARRRPSRDRALGLTHRPTSLRPTAIVGARHQDQQQLASSSSIGPIAVVAVVAAATAARRRRFSRNLPNYCIVRKQPLHPCKVPLLRSPPLHAPFRLDPHRRPQTTTTHRLTSRPTSHTCHLVILPSLPPLPSQPQALADCPFCLLLLHLCTIYNYSTCLSAPTDLDPTSPL